MIKTVKNLETIWQSDHNKNIIQIIDQRQLPHKYVIHDLETWSDGAEAIEKMLVRGAPLIGATAAWSVYLAAIEYKDNPDPKNKLFEVIEKINKTRPTAVNLQWALNRILNIVKNTNNSLLISAIEKGAKEICQEDADISRNIGKHGLTLIEEISKKKNGEVVNILTHCNAGALATIKYGTATAPIYFAHEKGIKVHVWVDETRPRNQGSQLTAWELAQNDIPHTLIVDNAGGHIMQHNGVDMCITGTDRTTRSGDVANKIGTYLKALAAKDNKVPFYVALPSSTIDWEINNGLKDIPIEERDVKEVSNIFGQSEKGLISVNTVASKTAIKNYAFDVTPAKLITGLITERGICAASEEGLKALFPEKN